jgi:hypothetical protein
MKDAHLTWKMSKASIVQPHDPIPESSCHPARSRDLTDNEVLPLAAAFPFDINRDVGGIGIVCVDPRPPVDPVPAMTVESEQAPIVPRATAEHICPRLVYQHVAPVTSTGVVMSVSEIHVVPSVAPARYIGAVSPTDQIISLASNDAVGSIAPNDAVGPPPGENQITSAEPLDAIVSSQPADHIASGCPNETVIPGCPRDRARSRRGPSGRYLRQHEAERYHPSREGAHEQAASTQDVFLLRYLTQVKSRMVPSES